MAERPRRAISKPDYVSMANCDIKLPRRTKKFQKDSHKDKHGSSEEENRLYRLKVLEEDVNNNLVKVRYIGYGSAFDEWRCRDEIVELSDESNSENDCIDSPDSIEHFCLFQELALRIKSLLNSYRKGNPICRIVMSFDSVSFDSLIIRSKPIPKAGLNSRQVYTIASMAMFEDLLGKRWYIRGVNLAGDFCFVTPGSLKFYLKHNKGRTEYQMTSDGTILKKAFGKRCQLIFSFVRGDGTSTQWSEMIKKCTSS